MKKYKKILKKEVYDIVCDICNKSCLNDFKDPQMAEYAVLEAFWGYSSRKDNSKSYYEICENCFDKIEKYIKVIKHE